MNKRAGFTLIEVSVAGALIAFTVLTALAIIPYGLRTQNEARMRTVAAAAVMTLGATPGTSVDSLLTGSVPLTKITRWDTRIGVPWHQGDPTPVAALKIPGTAPTPGDLTARLAYSMETGGGNRAITVWLLSKNPTDPGPMSAAYLATFTESN